MRQIVLYISLLLGAIGCRGSEEAVVESRSIASLWSYIGRETVLITEDISLRGYVVANDKYGELRRAIVVEDGSAGVMVELDMEDVELSIPLYSRVEVNCSGLWLAAVGPKLMLGAEPMGDFVVDRIPASKALNHISVLRESSDTPTIARRSIAELGYRDMLRYVSVAGLRLVDSEHGTLWTDVDSLTGRPITSVRHFVDANDTLRVVTDARCHYATDYIPTLELIISGVVDWYDGDIALRIIGRNID